MKEEELSHEESIEIIQGMISIAKNKIHATGFHFLLWGVLTIVASLTQYYMLKNGQQSISYWVWPIITTIGVPTAIVYELRKERSGVTKGRGDSMYGVVWLGFGITLLVTIFMCLSVGVNPIAFILSLVGLATFISGAIYRFVPLFIGAVVFWAAAAICSHLSVEDQLLMNAGALFIGYILPGILLWKRIKA